MGNILGFFQLSYAIYGRMAVSSCIAGNLTCEDIGTQDRVAVTELTFSHPNSETLLYGIYVYIPIMVAETKFPNSNRAEARR